MSETLEVVVPDIGDFTDVPVIELLVGPGDEVAAEDPLIVLESDKATMEVPSPADGTVRELRVAVGDQVSEGSPICVLEVVAATAPEGGAPAPAAGSSPPQGAPGGAARSAEVGAAAAGYGSSATGGPTPSAGDGRPTAPAAPPPPAELPDADHRAGVVVLGSGPGGYTAAFRAADLGLDVVLVERYATLGGVCLNVGCIPSKALLHLARVLAEAEGSAAHGLRFAAPEIDLGEVRAFKDDAVKRLTGGLGGMAKGRKVRVLQGTATVTGPRLLEVAGPEGTSTVAFEHLVVAAGSSAVRLPGLPDDPRVVTSTGALEVPDVPGRLLVIGGGIIGLEMATVYDALGARVTVVELLDGLIPGCDRDLVKPLQQRIAKRYEAILLQTRVTEVRAEDDGLHVTMEGPDGEAHDVFGRVLVAVGRRPNGQGLGLEAAGVEVDERGFVPVDAQQRTNVPHVFGIGDVVGEPMLAHKATHEAKVAAEVIAGHDVAFDARAIPSVAYTDPEVAWAGLTETAAAEEGREVEVARFPWQASGRAISTGRSDGLTKLVVDPGTRRVLGGGIVGVGASELIAEVVHAIEVGSDADDVGLTIHPHPTLSETVAFAAEVAAGTITDLPPQRRRSPAKA